MGVLSQALFLVRVLRKGLFSQGFTQRAEPHGPQARAQAVRKCLFSTGAQML
jgi:hypothetical protein